MARAPLGHTRRLHTSAWHPPALLCPAASQHLLASQCSNLGLPPLFKSTRDDVFSCSAFLPPLLWAQVVQPRVSCGRAALWCKRAASRPQHAWLPPARRWEDAQRRHSSGQQRQRAAARRRCASAALPLAAAPAAQRSGCSALSRRGCTGLVRSWSHTGVQSRSFRQGLLVARAPASPAVIASRLASCATASSSFPRIRTTRLAAARVASAHSSYPRGSRPGGGCVAGAQRGRARGRQRGVLAGGRGGLPGLLRGRPAPQRGVGGAAAQRPRRVAAMQRRRGGRAARDGGERTPGPWHAGPHAPSSL
jgi:hypothetical protein